MDQVSRVYHTVRNAVFNDYPLNKAFSYSFSGEYDLKIHLKPMDDVESPLRKQKLFLEGLDLLADKLAQERFRNIKRINAVSWAVRNNPDILEFFGFHVDREGKNPIGNYYIKEYERKSRLPPNPVRAEHRHIAAMYAWLDKDDFLKRPWRAQKEKVKKS